MQVANDSTVAGDFDDAVFDYYGTTNRFRKNGDRHVVRTPGADGVPADFDIAYTFGVEPLQQYLVEFPNGHLQPLPFAWDTRAADAGGQRWYHLYPVVENAIATLHGDDEILRNYLDLLRGD